MAIKEYGIKLPHHFSNGLLFRLSSKGELKKHAPFFVEKFLYEDPYEEFEYDEWNESQSDPAAPYPVEGYNDVFDDINSNFNSIYSGVGDNESWDSGIGDDFDVDTDVEGE